MHTNKSDIAGLYTVVFFQAIELLIRQRKAYIAVPLTVLYITVVLDLAGEWEILRLAVVIHDETRTAIASEVDYGPPQMDRMTNTALVVSALLADSLLVWRCYVLWHQNKWILGIYTAALLVEIVLLPIWLVTNITLGPLTFVSLYFIVSFTVTVISTILIIYRIFTVSRRADSKIAPYRFTTEILVESGALYTTNILVAGILLVLQANGAQAPWIIETSQILYSILVPVTGIAPTLITLRTASGNARPDAEWSQPISDIAFQAQESRRSAQESRPAGNNNAEALEDTAIRVVQRSGGRVQE
ncbi:hypothetical protein HYPSUDRAFT_53180 [Hypholoma sublateritium FD-334 SS-4]|uniref:Uncharacterized protein n=1 Tax=Hypholoma sublateritium (strain FD-334 SS-4) TaxID=945553 RepID=A0A0D2MMW8_HYPSF|nr:hypothetical protein HYPSUDRAFT_53180 [Hypholoma sublateritium FD-334 SS-4]